MKFFNESHNLINHWIKDYQIIFRQQYFPCVWIELHQDKAIEEITIIHNNQKIFWGVIVENHQEAYPIAYIKYFSLKNPMDLNFDEEYNDLYNTFCTYGCVYDGKYQWYPIIWNSQPESMDLIINPKNISIKEKPLEGLKLIIKKTSIIEYLFTITKTTQFIHNINDIKMPDNIIIENITQEDSMIHITYNHHLNMLLTENLIININESPNPKTIMFFQKNQEEYFNNKSCIDYDQINKIIKNYYGYSQFKYNIKFHHNRYFSIGQWVQIKYKGQIYKGIVIKSIINKNGYYWTNEITASCFINFKDPLFSLDYPKKIHIDPRYLNELWDQWKVIKNEKIKVIIPSLENYYHNINHENIEIIL